MEKITIIGNGFDIYHNLKTSYWDMGINLLKNLCSHSNEFASSLENINIWNPEFEWGQLETTISQEFDRSFVAQTKFSDDLIEYFHNNFFDEEFISVISEGKLDEAKIIRYQSGWHWNDHFEDAINDMELFKKNMINYIQKEVERVTPNIDDNIFKILNESNHILSYNYTSTEEVYGVKATHVHGDYKDGYESISFGRYKTKESDAPDSKTIFDAIIKKYNILVFSNESYKVALKLFEDISTYERSLPYGVLQNELFMKTLDIPINIEITNPEIYSLGFSWSKIDFDGLSEYFQQENANLKKCTFYIFDKYFQKVKENLIRLGVPYENIKELVI